MESMNPMEQTPMEQIPLKTDREYRAFDALVSIDIDDEEEQEEKRYIVEGYASTYEPYVLFEIDGEEIKEQVDRDAFTGADLDDVVFRIDHVGAVFARTSNGTLQLSTDEHGLKIRADLSRTEKARGVYEDIAAGMYPKMSFAFTVAEDDFDTETNTRTISRFKKLYDVAPVTFPANSGTEIGVSLRDRIHGEMEAVRAERLEAERTRKYIELRLRLM